METQAMFPVCAERNSPQAYARFFGRPSPGGWRVLVGKLAGFLAELARARVF